MPDPKAFLYDRGLADQPPAPRPQTMPFPFRMEGAELVAEQTQPPVERADFPDDYNARVLALEHATRVFADDGLENIQTAARWFHSFLMNAEPDEAPKEQPTFTDT